MTSQTLEYRLRQRILRRLAAGKSRNDAGVALLSALMFMIIMAGLGVVILSTVLGQVAPTYLAQKETHSVYGAQAGMQAALAMLRTAVYKIGGVTQYDPNGDGATLGDPTKLPCGFTGTVNPTTPADGVGYSVTIAYYDADPTGQSSTWLSTYTPTGNRLVCTPGSGVTSTTTYPVSYALLTATGTGNAVPGDTNANDGNRAISAVYQFKVSTYNIVGGLINDYNDGGAWCLSAVTATAGSKIVFLPASQCTAANASLQDWSYGSSYQIKLASTTVNGAAGLCITGPTSSSSNTTQNALLQACASSTSSTRWSQLWSWYGGNTWVGSNSSINGASSYNLGFATAPPVYNPPTTYTYLEVVYGTSNGFSPSTEVGAGNAGTTTSEIINYLEFGRCMDVTNQSIGSTNFLISYPCKQDPNTNGVAITWNQKFYYNEPTPPAQSNGPQAIIVNTYVPSPAGGTTNGTSPSSLPSADQYCLTTPGYPTTLPTAGAIPYVYACPSTTNYKEWTRVYSVTGDYGDSYLFTTTAANGTTLCLEVNPSITYVGWSELDVAACVGTNLGQKWNAPANYVPSEVGGYKEIGG